MGPGSQGSEHQAPVNLTDESAAGAARRMQLLAFVSEARPGVVKPGGVIGPGNR
jgi:hypothetical protein